MSTLSVNASGFEADPRRKQELLGRPIADSIYRRVFAAKDIQRNDARERSVLDRFYAIDVSITTPNEMILTGQEKFLSFEYARYRSVTVEYLQNKHTGEQGDWFKLAPMFYFVGYLTQDRTAFDPWVLINWPALVIASNAQRINWRDNSNKNSSARASFRYAIIDQLPPYCVIDSSIQRRNAA